MVEMEASRQWGANIFQECISFLDFPDLEIAENSAQKEKKYDIISMLCTVSRFPPIYVFYHDLYNQN